MSNIMIDALFYFLSFSPGVFWFLLIFFPHKKWAMTAYDIFLIFLSLIFTILTIPEIAYYKTALRIQGYSDMGHKLRSSFLEFRTWHSGFPFEFAHREDQTSSKILS